MPLSLKEKIKKAPQKPGIYIFKNKAGKFLYIGKSGNLRNRVRQYLKTDPQRPFSKYLLDEIKKVDFKTTGSEIEALILESKLIKEKSPKYNVMLRDGKQYFFVGITNDPFPRLFLTHQPYKGAEFIGPFTDGSALKTTLRLLRKVFPYCTCKQKHHNFCLNYHIGKCPGYCCLKENQNAKIKNQNYQKNIKAIKTILSGRKNSVVKNLNKRLNLLAEKQDFEKAIELRSKIEKLERVFENAKIIQNSYFIIHDSKGLAEKKDILKKLKQIFKLPGVPHRIEGYDISNIQGKNAVGAMVVFTDGQSDKNEYRKFKIRFKKTSGLPAGEADDTAMLKEILLRRFKHPEWPKPDLILIDGGKGQLSAANSVVKNIKIIALTKDKNHKPVKLFVNNGKETIKLNELHSEIKRLLIGIDAEAHRFAIGYYRKLQRKTVLSALLKNRF